MPTRNLRAFYDAVVGGRNQSAKLVIKRDQVLEITYNQTDDEWLIRTITGNTVNVRLLNPVGRTGKKYTPDTPIPRKSRKNMKRKLRAERREARAAADALYAEQMSKLDAPFKIHPRNIEL